MFSRPASIPRAAQLGKIRAPRRPRGAARQTVEALDIAVNFKPEGPNGQGVLQKPCIDCGNCVTAVTYTRRIRCT